MTEKESLAVLGKQSGWLAFVLLVAYATNLAAFGPHEPVAGDPPALPPCTGYIGASFCARVYWLIPCTSTYGDYNPGGDTKNAAVGATQDRCIKTTYCDVTPDVYPDPWCSN